MWKQHNAKILCLVSFFVTLKSPALRNKFSKDTCAIIHIEPGFTHQRKKKKKRKGKGKITIEIPCSHINSN